MSLFRLIVGILTLIALAAWVASRWVKIELAGFGPMDLIIISGAIYLSLRWLGKV